MLRVFKCCMSPPLACEPQRHLDAESFSDEERIAIDNTWTTLARHEPQIPAVDARTCPPGYRDLVQRIARSLDLQLPLVFPDASNANTRFDEPQRYTRQQLAGEGVCQSEYVRHVFGLLKLRLPVTVQAIARFEEKFPGTPAATFARSLVGISAADALRQLFERFPPAPSDRNTRNTAPVSAFLEAMTGIVFHPKMNLVIEPGGASVPMPLDRRHPGSFHRLPFMLLQKYCDALSTGQLQSFFNSAFIRERPCYEDVQQNILNHHAPEILEHPIPQWDHGLDHKLNFLGLFAVLQRCWLLRFLEQEKLPAPQLSWGELDRHEGSPEFQRFMQHHFAALRQEIMAQVPPHCQDEIATLLKLEVCGEGG